MNTQPIALHPRSSTRDEDQSSTEDSPDDSWTTSQGWYKCCLCGQCRNAERGWNTWFCNPYFINASRNLELVVEQDVFYRDGNNLWVYICKSCEATSRPEGQAMEEETPLRYPDHRGMSQCPLYCRHCLNNHRQEKCQYRTNHVGAHRCGACALISPGSIPIANLYWSFTKYDPVS